MKSEARSLVSLVRELDRACDEADFRADSAGAEEENQRSFAAKRDTLADTVRTCLEYNRMAEKVYLRDASPAPRPDSYRRSSFRSKSRELRGAKFGG